MLETLRYCSRCGAELTEKIIDLAVRQICPACETVFYRNPTPAASVLLLNEQREVLCLKRKQELFHGWWSLPTAFVEMGESVADAALRKLREEAGLEGHILHLLSADSLAVNVYGDVLIATFEAENCGGTERPGPDSSEIAYFPLDDLPPLAFRIHEKAAAACQEIHREEWRIQDSFRQLRRGGDHEMLSDELLRFMQERAGEIARRWLDDIRSNPSTPSYHAIDTENLLDKATAALTQFAHWLLGEEEAAEIQAFYRALGEERQSGGVPFAEVFSSLTIFRKHIWTFAVEQGVWQRSIDVYRILELDRRLMLFFDRAIYQTARGYRS